MARAGAIQAMLHVNDIQFQRAAMWSSTDALLAQGKPDAASVQVDVHFWRNAPHAPGFVQVLFLHASELATLGTNDDLPRSYCCTRDLINSGLCARAGELVLRPQNHACDAELSPLSCEVWSAEVGFGGNQSSAALAAELPVHRSGVHYLLLANCMRDTGTVAVSGRTVWQKPLGWLPAELAPLRTVYLVLAFSYFALGVIWMSLCLYHRLLLLPLQSYIGALVCVGCLEMACRWLDFESFHRGGRRHSSLVALSVMLAALKRTGGRLLVLSICLGYGVVRPTLGNVAYQVVVFGLVHLLLSACFELLSSATQLAEHSALVQLLLTLPVALLDAFYYYWLLHSLSRTLTQLSTRRQSAKLQLYRRFSHLLLAAFVLAACWILWQLSLDSNASLDARWRTLWAFDAFWHILFFVLILVVCFLWNPVRSNLQYAYMDELGQEPSEDHEDYDENHGGCSVGSSCYGRSSKAVQW